MKKKIVILGDSIMRGVMPDENGKYVIRGEDLYGALAEKYDISLTNCSAFGLTAKKALEKRLHIKCLTTKEGKCDVLLIALGGNDCDYNWQEISEACEAKHYPIQTTEEYERCLSRIVDEVREQGVLPILATILPVNAESYFLKSCEGRSKKNVLEWLNNDVLHIYRWQEAYAFAVARVARERDVILADPRSALLKEKAFNSLMSVDGIHLNEKGQAALAAYYDKFLSERSK